MTVFGRRRTHREICEQILGLLSESHRPFFRIEDTPKRTSIYVHVLTELRYGNLLRDSRTRSPNPIQRYAASVTERGVNQVHMTLPLIHSEELAGMVFDIVDERLFHPKWFKQGDGVTGIGPSRVHLYLAWQGSEQNVQRFFNAAAHAFLVHNGLIHPTDE